jgi:hypothetical protein
MRIVWFGLYLLMLAAAPGVRADLVEMQNGDRYSGTVLAVSADTVVLNSEMLGKINVPRNKVATLTFSTNANAAIKPATTASARPAATNLPAPPASIVLAGTNVNLSASLRQLGANTNFIGEIRQQMLASSPEATDKYDEMVNGLLSGQLDMNDLRRQAQTSADQLRELKRQLGPDADASLDTYLKVLDAFVNEAADTPSPLPTSAVK